MIEVEVLRIMQGTTDRVRVPVVVNDTTGMVAPDTPTLREGEEVVLFLFDVPAERGSVEIQEQDGAFGGLFGVVGGSQGVFDVIGDVAISRSDVEPLRMDVAEYRG
ncbi:MAG: hypothetical protein WED83_04200 [Acidimicrobiia bacterium]